jgi:hypothetical protein
MPKLLTNPVPKPAEPYPYRFLQARESNGRIDLLVVNEQGQPEPSGAYVLSIYPDGDLRVHTGVCREAAEAAGLKLDANRRIVERF